MVGKADRCLGRGNCNGRSGMRLRAWGRVARQADIFRFGGKCRRRSTYPRRATHTMPRRHRRARMTGRILKCAIETVWARRRALPISGIPALGPTIRPGEISPRHTGKNAKASIGDLTVFMPRIADDTARNTEEGPQHFAPRGPRAMIRWWNYELRYASRDFARVKAHGITLLKSSTAGSGCIACHDDDAS